MSESRTVEASGPDIESAITSGIAALGVSRDDVIVEVVEEPTPKGLFGLGGKPAKVRLTVIRAPTSATVPPTTSHASSSASPVTRQPQPQASQTPKAPPRGGHDDLDEAWS